MIHLVADSDLVTVVVDLRDATIEEIIAAISSALGDNLFFIPTEEVAA